MRQCILLASFVLLSVSARLQAQIKLPVFDEDRGSPKNIRFEEASTASDFRHGRLVRVSMNGDSGTVVQGILVRVDKKNERVYVRTEPGSPPRAFDAKQIKKVEKGVVREVGHSNDINQSEIHEMVIYNGGRRSVSYSAPSLSPGELDRLRDLQIAENEAARLDHLASLEERVLENDVAIQTEQRRAAELRNELLWRQISSGVYTYQVPLNGIPFAITEAAASGASPSAAVPEVVPSPFVRVGPTLFPGLSVDPNARSAARQKLLTAQSLGVYEQGRLVAVVVPESAK